MYYQGEALRYLLALLRIPKMGARRLHEIFNSGEDLSSLFNSRDECLVIPGVADWEKVDQDLRWLGSPNCHMITIKDDIYPKLLKEVAGAPPVFFLRGDIQYLSKPQIAIVGSRNPTPIGYETALKFSEYFSKKGFTVTSGLALGIDSAAHKAALLGIGGSIAVLGNGLDRIYPPSNRSLAIDIVEKGALVSEFPIGVSPMAANFPRRNRLISGLSLGVLVVEATLNSGSLITAKYALEQSREVFAIPGSIHSPLAKGCHALIKQGAKLVETADDVLEELGALMKYIQPEIFIDVPNVPDVPKAGRQAQKKLRGASQPISDLGEPFESLLSYIGYEPTAVDVIVGRSGLTASKVSSMLLELELKGYILSIPGGYSRRALAQ